MEAVAETDEELMDRFFEGDEFTAEEIIGALKTSVADGSIVPVLAGCSLNLQGVNELMADIVGYLPDPSMRELTGTDLKNDGEFAANYDEKKAEKSAFIFKSIVDPFIGKYSLLKVASGVITSDDTLYSADLESEVRVSKLYVFQGSKPLEVKELHAGDIGAIGKLDCATGDTLSTKAAPVRFQKPEFSVPYTYKRYAAKNKGDDDKISSALAKLAQEDMTLRASTTPRTVSP